MVFLALGRNRCIEYGRRAHGYVFALDAAKKRSAAFTPLPGGLFPVTYRRPPSAEEVRPSKRPEGRAPGPILMRVLNGYARGQRADDWRFQLPPERRNYHGERAVQSIIGLEECFAITQFQLAVPPALRGALPSPGPRAPAREGGVVRTKIRSCSCVLSCSRQPRKWRLSAAFANCLKRSVRNGSDGRPL